MWESTGAARAVGKDTLHLCVSAIDADGRVSVKGSSKFSNLTSNFENMEAWCDKHCKDKTLPVRYLMESTGVYHEQIAWYLFRADRQVSVVLPRGGPTNKAKHYLRSLGHKSKNDRSGGRKIDARGLAQMGLDRIAEATELAALATLVKGDIYSPDAHSPARLRPTVSGYRS